MSKKKRMVSYLLCLSLCFFIGCKDNSENGKTETDKETYTGRKKINILESQMANQRERGVTQKNIGKETERQTLLEHTNEKQENNAEVILNKKQIKDKNENSFAMYGNGLVDLERFRPQSAEEIYAMVNGYSIPAYAYFDGRIRTKEDDERLLASRNLEQISDPVYLHYGVITKSAAVRSFPTEKAITKEGKADDLDYIQESMLGIGEGVVICHQTMDKKYSFVQGYQYRGWILTECIGFCDKEEMVDFIKADSFIVVTDAVLNMRNEMLRMGTKLPMVKKIESGYLVQFPIRDKKGNLQMGKRYICKSSASLGYLAYTEENLLNQAYKMIGQPYGWGDTDGYMDCSSTMNSIFRVFGIYMPRNTSKFSKFDAKVTDLSSMGEKEKEETIKHAGIGSLILLPGHVVMYVGEKNGKSEILHNVTGYSLDGGEAMTVMECRVTPMEIYSTGGIFYPKLFTTLVEVE